MILTNHAVGLCAKANHHITQYTVVHVQAAFPEDLSGINLKSVALLDVVIQECCQKVIGRSDGMEITGKMKV